MIAIIDYEMGNLLSVKKALEFVGAFPEITSSPVKIHKADAIVLPGVGNFGDGIKHLKKKRLDVAIKNFISSGKPFLGICLGMQLLMEASEEAPDSKGLGIFKGGVVRFPDSGLKVPHMGWNQLKIENYNPCLAEVPDMSYFYFVHSYFVRPDDPGIIAGSCSYGVDFAAAIGKGNIFATQFHPEKSQDLGLRILRNFTKIVHYKNSI